MLKKRSLSIIFLAVIAVVCGFLSFNFYANGNRVKAETTVSIQDVDLKLYNGASVRWRDFTNSTDNGSTVGLRFKIYMDKTDYESLEASSLYSNVEYGILIAPSNYQLTFENVFGANAIYNWSVGGTYVSEAGKTRIINLSTGSLEAESQDTVVFYGSITGIKDNHMLTDYKAVGYIKAYDIESNEYVYSMTNNVQRNITHIANQAVLDNSISAPTSEQKGWLQNKYIDVAVDYARNNNISYFYQNGQKYYIDSSIIGDVDIYTQEDFEAFVSSYNNGLYNNAVLHTNVSYTLYQDAQAEKSVINTLYTTFDGNGYSVTINYATGEGGGDRNESHYNFVNTVASTGEIKNTKFVFSGNWAGITPLPHNLSIITFLTKTNNGTIRDIEMSINIGSLIDVWLQNIKLVAVEGVGSIENAVISLSLHRYDADTLIVGPIAKRCLVITQFSADKFIGESATNSVLIANSREDVGPFDEFTFVGSLWDTDAYGVPCLVNQTTMNYVTVSTAEELIEAASSNVNIKLASDITVDLEQDNSSSKAAINKLSTTLNGDGHTLTVNYTGTARNSQPHNYNLVNTVTETGVIENLRVVFTGSINNADNLLGTSFLTVTNNGIIRNVVLEIKTSFSNSWDNASVRAISALGTGVVNNVIVVNSVWAASGLVLAADTNEVTNVLFIGGLNGYVATDFAKNVVAISNAANYYTSGFSLTSFNGDSPTSVWQDNGKSIPTFKQYFEVSSEQELLNYVNAGKNVVLTKNLSFSLEQGAESTKYVIETLKSKIDGNGNTVTINFTGVMTTDCAHYYNFVNTVTETGEIKNLKVAFTGIVTRSSVAYNASPMSYLTKTNNGSIHDVVVDTSSCGIYWTWITGMSYVANDGNGTVNNVIVIDPAVSDSKNNGEAAWYIASGTVTNVLYTGIASGRISSDAQNNVLSIPTGGDTSSFDFTSFDIDGNSSNWTMKGGLPVLYQKVEYNTVVVNTQAEFDAIIANYDTEPVNISLNTDLTYNFTMSSANPTQYVMQNLNSRLNGNGHKVNINIARVDYSGAHNYNFINTISANGVLENIKVVFSGMTYNGVNLNPLTYLTYTNNGLIENVYIDTSAMNISWSWTMGLGYISYTGSGSANNVVVYDPANGDAKSAGEGSRIIGAGTLTNVLYIGACSNVLSSSGDNVVKVSSENAIGGSGFDTSSFNTDIWDLNGTVPTIIKYAETVDVYSAQEMLDAVSSGKHVNLKVDLSFDLAQGSDSTKYVIETLNSKFNGNGHTVTVNFTGLMTTNCAHYYNFINTVSEYGELSDLKVVFTGVVTRSSTAYNASPMSYLTKTNNGKIHDVVVDTSSCGIYWTWITGMSYVSNDGNGTVNNVIVIDPANYDSKNNGEGTWKIASGTVTNVLYTGIASGRISSDAQNNIVSIATGGDTSSFWTLSFNTGIWDLSGSVPTLKREQAQVSTVADLQDAAAKGCDIELLSDLTVNFTMSSANPTQYVIETLNSTLNGNGHTVTINIARVDYSGAHNYNFINTISANGVLENIKVAFSGSTYNGVNLSPLTYLTYTNNGLIENVYIDTAAMSISWSWTVGLGYISYTGSGSANNVVVYDPANGDAKTGGEGSRIIGAGTLTNVLYIGACSNVLSSSGSNVVKVASASDIASSGFSTSSFSTDIWDLSENIPTLIRNVETVEAWSVLELQNALAQGLNVNLMADLSVDLAQGAYTTKYVIETLNSKLNGNGHIVTVNFTGIMTTNGAHYYNFINTVSKTGELLNLKVAFTGTVTRSSDAYNASPMSYLTKTNNGSIHDVVVDTSSCGIYWAWITGMSYVANDGNGTVNNVIVIDPAVSDSKNNGEAAWYIASGTVTNVLYTGIATGRISSDAQNNVLSIPTGGDISSFDTSSFSTDIWDLSGSVPAIKSTNEIPTLYIYTGEQLLDYVHTKANYELMEDVEVNMSLKNSSYESIIKTLDTTFNGNSHTITINWVAGDARYNLNTHMHYNFVNTISSTGVLKNTRFVFGGFNNAADGNINYSYVSYTNNGTMENVILTVNTRDGGDHWAWTISYLSVEGTGTINKAVIYSNFYRPDADAAKIGSGTISNVLFYGVHNGKIGNNASKNIYSFASVNSGMGNFKMDALDEVNSPWTLNSYGIPDLADVSLLNFAPEDIKNFVIVIPDEATDKTMEAAFEFKYLYKKFTGEALTIVYESNYDGIKPYVSIGTTNLFLNKKFSYDNDELGISGTFIASDAVNLFAYGYEDKGVLYAVYDLMDYLYNYEYYARDCMTFDTTYRDHVGMFAITNVPYIQYRAIGYYETDNFDLNKDRLRVNTLYDDVGADLYCHTFNTIYPISEHEDCYSKDNTNCYNLCYSTMISNTTDYLDVFVSNLEAKLDNCSLEDRIMVAQEDSKTYCTCNACKNRILSYYGSNYTWDEPSWIELFNGKTQLSDAQKKAGQTALMIEFLNLVCNKIKEDGYEHEIVTFAYNQTAYAPKGIFNQSDIADNLYFMVVPYNPNYDETFEENTSDYFSVEQLEGWAEITDKLYIYTYDMNFDRPDLPFVTYDTWAMNYYYFNTLGVVYVYTEGVHHYQWVGRNFAVLKEYLHSKYMWNPMSYYEEDLVYNFIYESGYYGEYTGSGEDVCDYIYEYFNAIKDKFADLSAQGKHQLSWDHDSLDVRFDKDEFSAKELLAYKAILDNAMEACGNNNTLKTRVGYETVFYKYMLDTYYPEVEI